ncbi:MAG: hypothetical protein GF330_14625 [Candidatus Eisenbacteria bacterium]|nr:hypothetical protein [Candidatus Eisenbacteria bacterium]
MDRRSATLLRMECHGPDRPAAGRTRFGPVVSALLCAALLMGIGRAAASHDVITQRRVRVDSLRTRLLRESGDPELALALAAAYRDCGMHQNALRVLQRARERHAFSASLTLAWARLFLELVTPDRPRLVRRSDFLTFYGLANRCASPSTARAELLVYIARLHHLTRRRERADDWWNELLPIMERTHPGLRIRDTWRSEIDDVRRHTLAAFYALRAALRTAPGHIQARLLAGIVYTELGRHVEAYAAFQRAFDGMLPEERAPYFTCEFLATPEQIAALGRRHDRSAFWDAFWAARAERPGSLIHRDQIEFWRRVALAQLHYGPAEIWLADAGHPARILIRLGEPEEIEIVPTWSEMDATMNVDLARRRAAKETFIHRQERRGETLLTYDQAGRGYRLQPRSRARLERITRGRPISLPNLGEEHALFFADHVSVPLRWTDRREHLCYALLPLGGGESHWAGARLRTQLLDAAGNAVRAAREARLGEADLRETPLGRVVLGAEVLTGLLPGAYLLSLRLESQAASATYDYPFTVRDAATHCPPGKLCVGEVEFAFGGEPTPEQPHFARGGWRYIPNPTRVVDCSVADDCRLSIVFDVRNVARDDRGQAVLTTHVFVVPQEFIQYRRHLADCAEREEAPLGYDDLAPRFARRAACSPAGEQRQALLSPRMCRILRSGPTLEQPRSVWSRVTVDEVVPMRPVDRFGRVLVPLRIDLRGLEPGTYGIYIEAFDRVAERREQRTVRAIGHRDVWFQILDAAE